MKHYRRLPRKLKKQIGASWKQYMEEQNILFERDRHLEKIFDKDYNDSRAIVQQTVNI